RPPRAPPSPSTTLFRSDVGAVPALLGRLRRRTPHVPALHGVPDHQPHAVPVLPPLPEPRRGVGDEHGPGTPLQLDGGVAPPAPVDRKSTRLNSSHVKTS